MIEVVVLVKTGASLFGLRHTLQLSVVNDHKYLSSQTGFVERLNLNTFDSLIQGLLD